MQCVFKKTTVREIESSLQIHRLEESERGSLIWLEIWQLAAKYEGKSQRF